MEGVEREKKKEIREMEGDKWKVIKIKHTLWYIQRFFFFTATEEERVGVCDSLYVCEGVEERAVVIIHVSLYSEFNTAVDIQYVFITPLSIKY